jgi:hypothetical protein
MLNLLWDLHQQHRISRASAEAERAAGEARSARSIADSHERRLDALTLTNLALWSYIREKLGVSEEQLIRRIEEIDLSDGRLDGRVTAAACPCSQCGRMVSHRHARCLYCGATTHASPTPA